MIKKAIFRGINSFMYAIGIYTVLQLILSAINQKAGMIPVLPEFSAQFQNEAIAMLVQTVLIGIIGAAFGAGSVLMELERLSLIAQSILYFIVTTAVGLPIGCFCWGFHKYPQTRLSMGLSYLISYLTVYIVNWVIQYRLCKSNIEQINKKLLELKEEESL